MGELVLAAFGLAVGVASATTGAVQQSNAQSDAKKAREQQEAQRQKALADAKERESNQKKIKAATISRDIANQRLKQKASEKAGRSGTIVSGPLGVPSANAQSGAAKTAIGE